MSYSLIQLHLHTLVLLTHRPTLWIARQLMLVMNLVRYNSLRKSLEYVGWNEKG